MRNLSPTRRRFFSALGAGAASLPVRDPDYRVLRLNIGIAAQDGLSIDADTLLHPSLRLMANLWEQRDVQIVEDVGYLVKT